MWTELTADLQTVNQSQLHVMWTELTASYYCTPLLVVKTDILNTNEKALGGDKKNTARWL